MADCLFCRIVAGEIPADIIAQNDGAIAFSDLNPVAPTHALVIPREHLDNVAEVAAKAPEALADMVNLAAQVAASDGIAETGYRLVANTGRDGHQTVFHAHIHVLGGRSMGWPPG